MAPWLSYVVSATALVSLAAAHPEPSKRDVDIYYGYTGKQCGNNPIFNQTFMKKGVCYNSGSLNNQHYPLSVKLPFANCKIFNAANCGGTYHATGGAGCWNINNGDSAILSAIC